MRSRCTACRVIKCTVIGGIHSSLLTTYTLVTLLQLALFLGKLLLGTTCLFLNTHILTVATHCHLHHAEQCLAVFTVLGITCGTLGLNSFLGLGHGTTLGIHIVFALGICLGILATGKCPYLLIAEITRVLPFETLHILRILHTSLLHFGLMTTLVLLGLLLGTLHRQELLELRIILFTLKLALALGVIEIHITATLLDIKRSIRGRTLFLKLLIVTCIIIIVTYHLYLNLLARDCHGLVGLTFKTYTLELYAVAELHHCKGCSTFVLLGLQTVAQSIHLLLADKPCTRNLGKRGLALIITACLTDDTLIGKKILEFLEFILMEKVVTVNIVELML